MPIVRPGAPGIGGSLFNGTTIWRAGPDPCPTLTPLKSRSVPFSDNPPGNVNADYWFDNPAYWSTSGGVTVDAGTVGGVAVSGYAWHTEFGIVLAGYTYDYSFTISEFTAGTVEAYVGPTPVFSAAAGAAGTFTGSFTPTTSGEFGLRLLSFTGKVDKYWLVPQPLPVSMTAAVGTFSYSGQPATLTVPNPALPILTIVNNTNTTITHLGSGVYNVEKTSGATATYNAGAVSSTGATGDFVLRIKGTPGVSGWGQAVGVNSDPLTDDDYASIDNTFVYIPNTDQLSIMESGTNVVTGLANSTYAWIWRIGGTLGYGRGATLGAAQASPDRTVASSGTLYFDSSLPLTADKVEVLMYEVSGTTAYSMTAAVGTFSFTGQAATLRTTLLAAVGTFSYTGQAALFNRSMAGALGTFSYTGQVAQLTATYRMAGALGTFGYTGQVVLLTRAYSMPGALGSFSYTGQSANFTRLYDMAATVGTFTYAGQAATIGITATMPAGLGTFSYAGQPSMATLSYGSVPPSGGGSSGPKVTAFFYRS